MWPYILLALSPLFCGVVGSALYRDIEHYEKRNKFIVVAVGICVFFMIALRCKDIGSQDSNQYYYYWGLLKNFSFSELITYMGTSRLEVGFLSSTWLLSHIPVFANPQFIFVFSGLVIVICFGTFIYENSDDVILSWTMFITLGLYTFMVQGLRQAIAMSICISAIRFCKERKFIKFLVLVIIASLFHQTAIVFLTVFFIYYLKMDQKSLAIALGSVILLLVFCNSIIRVFNSFFDMGYGIAVDSGGFVAVAIYIISLLLAWISRDYVNEDHDYTFFFYVTFIGCGIYLVRYFGAQAAERISFYFMAGQIITLPKAMRRLNQNSSPIVFCAVWLLCILLFVYRLRGSNLLPYHFFWQG